MYVNMLNRRRRRVRYIPFLIALVLSLVISLLPLNGPSSMPAQAMDLNHFPLSFVPNLGQINPLVKFQVHNAKNSIFFTPNDVVLLLHGAGHLPGVVQLHFIGANHDVAVEGIERLAGVVNYLRGNNPFEWYTDLPTFGAIVYKDLYPGVELRYDGSLSELKGTFTLAAGVDPTCIRWRHFGASEVVIDEDTGELIITMFGPANFSLTLVEAPPVVSQEIEGESVPVEAGYVIYDDGSVGFELGDYNPDYALIIDPTLEYSTYLGGSNIEDVEGIARDDDGNIYVVGTTSSNDFPTELGIDTTLSGDEDIYVAKINAAGDALLYSTYIGGRGDDEGSSIAVDADGNAYIIGATDSSNYPTHNAYSSSLNGLEDAIVTKLNAAGDALVYSTYLGGSHLDDGLDIAVDTSGNAYLIGFTFSTNFPTKGAIQSTYGGGGIASGGDAFITKLNAAGDALVYSTYMGGNATDSGAAIAVDSAGCAYVVGETWSTNFPTQNPLQAALKGHNDLFLAKLNVAGDALTYSTYLGGSDDDYSYDIAVDTSGNAYVTGNTLSTDYPTVNPLQAALAGDSDAFLTKMNAAGDAWVYSTYMGGSAYDKGYGVAVDSDEIVYVVGATSSTDFPVIDSIQTYGGDGDAFVAKVKADGSALLYNTYLGGTAADYGVDVVMGEDDDSIYLAGITFSDDFPTVDPLYNTYSGTGDVFIARIDDESIPIPKEPDLSTSYKAVSVDEVISGDTLSYTIHLHNTGDGIGVASVTDVLPDGLDYIPGSVGGGGTYDAGTHTLSWTGVTVAANDEVALTFSVTATEVTTPTTITNMATIVAGDDTFERDVDLLVNPPKPEDADFTNSYKMASEIGVNSGQMVTFTIGLVNSGGVAASVAVSDPLPSGLNYVPGSVTGGGVYDTDTRTLTWDDVSVAAGSHEKLLFVVTPTAVTTLTEIANIATIMAPGETLERMASVLIVPPKPGEPDLMLSYKIPSMAKVDSGATFSFTIGLVNSGGVAATVTVNDPLPTGLDYVAGSASDGGIYDTGTRTLTWTGLSVGAGEHRKLTFDVTAIEVASSTLWTNIAEIMVLTDPTVTLERRADVLVLPVEPDPANLTASYKHVSQFYITSGDMFTFTIGLVNSGETNASVTVEDPLPAGLDYVAGSASNGGVYDSGTLKWTAVDVAAGSHEKLTFSVTAADVDEVTEITNVATIMAGDDTLARQVKVFVHPIDKPEAPDLHLSYKVASEPGVVEGETLTFTIGLVNSGDTAATVTVSDPLPTGLEYVAGSGDAGGGVYDAGTRTLTWTDVDVAGGAHEKLMFAVTAADVEMPVTVKNTVTIVHGDSEIKRHAAVLVSPEWLPKPDVDRPVIHQVLIDEQDVVSDASVTLHISATDNIEVEWMYIREWYLETLPIPHWEVIRTTDWMTYEAETEWSLYPQSGVHFVSVWVADAEYNVSLMTPHSIDYASLLLAGETVLTGGFVPYMVHYESGESVNAVLTPVSGDPDLYVWYPGNFGLPDVKSFNSGAVVDSVSFETPSEGDYLFLVHGYSAATYNFTITPGGGLQNHKKVNQQQVTLISALNGKRGLLFEPVFSQCGLDPLSGGVTSPTYYVFLPLILK